MKQVLKRVTSRKATRDTEAAARAARSMEGVLYFASMSSSEYVTYKASETKRRERRSARDCRQKACPTCNPFSPENVASSF